MSESLCLLAQKYKDLVREVARAGQVEGDACLGGDARNITADLDVRASAITPVGNVDQGRIRYRCRRLSNSCHHRTRSPPLRRP